MQRLQLDIRIRPRHCPGHIFRIEDLAFRGLSSAEGCDELLGSPLAGVSGRTDIGNYRETRSYRFAALHVVAMTSLTCDSQVFAILNRNFRDNVGAKLS